MKKLTTQELAMFIGCDCQVIQMTIPYMLKYRFAYVGDIIKIDFMLLLSIQKMDIEIKPILRPLSDLTKEEAWECWRLCEGNPYLKYAPIQELISDNMHTEEFSIKEWAIAVKYLISKHFDVFDWIEKSLAIDKTKI